MSGPLTFETQPQLKHSDRLICGEYELSNEDRLLTEVDNLLAHRTREGQYEDQALRDVRQNLVTAVQEAAMPYAVTTTRHRYEKGEDGRGRFMWLGKTAVEAAMGGYKFHRHSSAHQRVDVEVDEAKYAEQDHTPGTMKVFISPRMTEADAPKRIAKEEHLADDDAVRVSWLVQNEDGTVKERVLQSLLVRDIPLDAWQAMLEDPNNAFGKSIGLNDHDSALSVMKAHRDLEVNISAFPYGPVSVVQAVVPYIAEPEAADSVRKQLEMFYDSDQEDLASKAELITDRWLDFELALSESLVTGETHYSIQNFIISLQDHWRPEDLDILQEHEIPGGGYKMTRHLAAIVERARQNTLWSAAAIATGNEAVINQISPEQRSRIYQNELAIQHAQINGLNYNELEARNIRRIATQNLKVGGGCSGNSTGVFDTLDNQEGDGLDSSLESSSDRKNWKWKSGVCRVEKCPSRPGITRVGPCDVCEGCQVKADKGQKL